MKHLTFQTHSSFAHCYTHHFHNLSPVIVPVSRAAAILMGTRKTRTKYTTAAPFIFICILTSRFPTLGEQRKQIFSLSGMWNICPFRHILFLCTMSPSSNMDREGMASLLGLNLLGLRAWKAAWALPTKYKITFNRLYIYYQTDCKTDWPSKESALHWLNGWLTDLLTDCWLAGWLTDRWTDW